MSTLFPDENVNAQTENYHQPTDEQLRIMRGGANWFYWIAGLSMVNSLIFAFGGEWNFIIGLAYTQIIDAFSDVMITEGGPEVLRLLAVGLNVVVFSFFALFGYYASRGFKAAFLAGIVIYAIDAMLWIFFDGVLQIGFHIFALIIIVRGYLVCREINKFTVENPSISPAA